jgi:hypothetical protein
MFKKKIKGGPGSGLGCYPEEIKPSHPGGKIYFHRGCVFEYVKYLKLD